MSLLPLGSIGFLLDFGFYMAAFGVGGSPTGFIAPLRLNMLDSQTEKSNMGPVPIDFHDFRLFKTSCHGFLIRYLSCFRPGRSQERFSRIWVGTKKMHGEKLRRFVVVSPREVPSLPCSCPFKIFEFCSFFKVPPIVMFRFLQKSVH